MIEDCVYLKPIDYDNIEDLRHNKVTHVIMKRMSYYILMIHGSPNGGVCYNGILVNFQELSILLRNDLNIPLSEQLNVLVYCCFAQSQVEYIDGNTNIRLMYDNIQELYFELHPSFCIFSYTK